MPHIKDNIAWKMMILDHRRALLERLILEYPDVMLRDRTKIEFWRTRLRVGYITD